MTTTIKWFCALPFALAAFGAISADAAGRSPDSFSPPTEVSSPGAAIGAYVYDDVLRPHGRQRSSAVKKTDGDFCDHGDQENIGGPAFDACMLARGWRFSRFEPAPAGAYAYNDILKPHGRERSDVARQVATRACDHGHSADIGDDAFNACMLARGWRFAGAVPDSSDSSDTAWSASPDPSPSADSGSDAANQAMEMVNEENATNAANAAAQQQFNDAMAAAQQTENNANFIQQ